MINYLQYWINDFGSDMWAFWNRGYERWRHAWAGYWSNFGMIILIFLCFGYIMVVLGRYHSNTNFTTNLLGAKIALFLGTMFIIVYGCVIIITLSGYAGIATFCSVLREVNSGNKTIIDQLPLAYTSYTKIILKECT